MATSMSTTTHADLVDKRVSKIANISYRARADLVPRLYQIVESTEAQEQMSALGDVRAPVDLEVTKKIQYVTPDEQYKTTLTYKEWTLGLPVTRRLWQDIRDSQFRRLWKLDQLVRPFGLSFYRKRQTHAASILETAFDGTPPESGQVREENIPLCSTLHPITPGGAVHSNKSTLPLNYTNLTTVRGLMKKVPSPSGEKMGLEPDTLVVNEDLESVGYETLYSLQKADTANNNVNFYKSRNWSLVVVPELTSSTAWFLADSLQAEVAGPVWVQRVPFEVGFSGDFESYDRLYSFYEAHAFGWIDWRWVYGSTGEG